MKVLLSSGGMDSFLLAHEPELEGAKHVFVNVGQAYVTKEKIAARYVAKSAGAEFIDVFGPDLCKFEHKPTGIIPFRNAELILCAAQHGEQIYMGVIADEVNSDKSPEFFNAMEMVLNISHRKQYWTEGREYSLLTPFREFSKTELVRRFLQRGGKLLHLLRSVSCYSQQSTHCGRCSSCFKRWVALTCATGIDAMKLQAWERHPAMWHDLDYWKEKLTGYSERRQADVFQALEIAKREGTLR